MYPSQLATIYSHTSSLSTISHNRTHHTRTVDMVMITEGPDYQNCRVYIIKDEAMSLGRLVLLERFISVSRPLALRAMPKHS